MQTTVSHKKCTLLYLVYGQNPQYQQELSYSVLSALRDAQDQSFEVLLVCDVANQRPDLPVSSYVLSDAEQAAWSLNGTYNHAIKIFALQKALEITGGKVCFVDTDTAFKRDPKALFDRVTDSGAVMHAAEGSLGDLHSWTSLLEKVKGTEFASLVQPQAAMYNSGLIGLTPAMSDQLQQAIDLMRALHALEPVFNIEQFVLGAVLGQGGSIHLAEDIVDHYWGYRRHIYHGHIPQALLALDGQYTTQTARNLPVITDPEKPFTLKLRARLHALWHGADANYRFAYLAYLASNSAQNTQEQQIWAQIARDMLDRTDATALARASFRRFAPEALKNSGLTPDMQRQWATFWSATR